RVELKPSTRKSITEPSVLLREIAEIRRDAIAFDDGEFNPEVRCVAVPVYNSTGEVIGALGISGPIWRMTDQVLQSRAKLVQTAASRLSAEFGAPDLAKSSRSTSDPGLSVSFQTGLRVPRDAFGVGSRRRVRKYLQ